MRLVLEGSVLRVGFGVSKEWPYQSFPAPLLFLFAEFSPFVLAAADANVEVKGVGIFAACLEQRKPDG